jgi:PhnB protein
LGYEPDLTHWKEMTMPHPIAYLGFNGNCAEAMRFYASALDAKLEMLMSGADSPVAAQIPKEFADRILHARLALEGGGYLYAGDVPTHVPYKGMHGISVTLNYDTVAEARKVFDRLAVGGQVSMAMAPAFWANAFGMLVDKFGTPWIINGELLAH